MKLDITTVINAKLASLYTFLMFLSLVSCSHKSRLSEVEKQLVMNDRKMKIIGWREWISLPDLGIKNVKAKVDTGARTSSIHAYDIEKYRRDGKDFVKFKVRPDQDSSKNVVECRARVLEYRKVKSSNGQTQLRPVIVTNIELLGEKWPVEITLSNRDEMGFRMLLGRASFKKKFLVNVGKSFYSEKK